MSIIEKLPMSEYLAMSAVSASLLRTIVAECPRAAWYQSWLNPKRPTDDGTKASDAGEIAHGILLEGSYDTVCVIDPEDHPAERTGAIPAGFTNKSIRAARDVAILAGKIPVLKDDFANIEAMVDEAWRFMSEDVRQAEPAIWAAFNEGGGDSELTITWNDGPTACRIRPDRISKDRRLICDYKTTKTSAEPDRWGRTQMVGMGYYTSAAFYHRGIVASCGESPAYVFLVQSQDPPYLCSLVGVDPHAMDLGAQKIAYGLALWQACAKSGKWPGYPGRVCYPEIPQWEDSRWEEREEQARTLGRPFTEEDLTGGIPL